MIPSVLSRHIEQGVKDFLQTTFPITTPLFAGLFDRLLEEPGTVFKGPYLDIKLPFQQGTGGNGPFPELPLPFPAYLHQERAFDRLAGPSPRSTIVATGTGSGKTECFLLPILDYCYRHRGEAGIKAILIYPMNALATDQAKRLATLIHGSKLNGHVTAGLYIGQREQHPSMLMTADRLISDKNTMRLSPPDILLTNYKMLDYLLIRPEDRPVWQHNTPDTLRFLVVDELHTFDGAQGADLGCLVRRLKGRLGIEPDRLCCVGTSATLGDESGQADLLAFAGAVFGEPFNASAIITEARLSAGGFLGDSLIAHVDIVPPERVRELDPGQYGNHEEFVRQQHLLWFDEDIPDCNESAWRVELGDRLKQHLFFQNLLKILGGTVHEFDEIFGKLEKVTRGLQGTEREYRALLLNSLLSLVSEARVTVVSKREDGSETVALRPFLDVRLQVWMRELRRMVASVGHEPALRFADDLNEEQLQVHLPLVHCRECGAMGWSGLKRLTNPVITGDLKDFYHCFFSHDPKIVYLFPEENRGAVGAVENGPPQPRPGRYYLCNRCLHVTAQNNLHECPACGNSELVFVFMPEVRVQRGSHQQSHNDCPFCDSRNSLTLVGSRAASLTSVMIVQLFSSPFNDDKKLLTFSDNVQDAAHRAGFFNGRTYRFNFRTALQQVVLDEANGRTLAELPAIFTRYWKSKVDLNRYIATFLAPNMEWLNDFDTLRKKGSLPADSSLVEQVDRRVGWEIVSGYGFQARIGRTLEKTGSSVVYLDPERTAAACEQLLEPIRNEIGTLRQMDQARLTSFVLGLVVHLKNQGGICQPHLAAFIESFGSAYTLNKIFWMPSFGPMSRTPSFLTTKRGSRFDQLFSASPTHRTWYQSWAEKCFYALSPVVLAASKTLYDLVLKGLVTAGILAEFTVRGDRVWGLCPEQLRVSARVKQMRCRECGHTISVAEEEHEHFIEAPCQRFHCYGRYEPYDTGHDYYGQLYATGDVERIFAREHTGLLKRDEREQLELQFKADGTDRRPWFPNLLSCTPTLEMGIDIGNLSSLVLCSVPPAQANYLQRIGRAGRRDGNALNLTVANARPHDLFFFAEPKEMIAGHVDAPGVFLDASAVLERQLTAFCFDRWIADTPRAAIPKKLGQVLSNLKTVDAKKFPHNFIQYIETNQADLFDHFVLLFENDGIGLSEESVENLRHFVEGDGEEQWFLRGRIMNGLHSRQLERASLKQKVQTLNAKIKKKQNAPHDMNFEAEMRELAIEKSALQTLISSLSDRDTFNFFTDEGLLPNYAFPEVGVMLNSLIYRKKSKVQEGGGSYETWHFEYERPARSAIEELAPANTFYAEGRKVRVDQVDMAVSEIETWRFCNNCSHKELLGKDEEREVCVHCGSPMWSDAGQKRLMLRMRQVFASTSDRESRISDDSDDRDPVFYNKQMLVEFDDKQVRQAFKVDADFPFGFDFLTKVDFCEINFGERTEIGEKTTIAGVEMPRKGFTLCRSCGKVQDGGKGKQKPAHAFTCTAKDQESDKHLLDCLYLYRQFVSEAIRILLPVSIISDSKRRLHSFIAAIQLGLKKRFKGRIDHLQTTVHEEPLPDSSFKRKYLVLYDTVPGGTGYLKQLMRSSDELMDILQLALEALKSCPCNQDGAKDGCYRCLYAYRNSYNMKETSRDTAIELLAEILSYKDRLVKTDTIRDISMNTFIESELEARFIGALKKAGNKSFTVRLENDLVNGKPGYFLKVGDRAYYIEPQVELGSLNGISIESRADFVIRPARFTEAMKPIAVFLDGFAYHNNRIGKDMAQRMAIVQSDQWHVWSLTWQDVENNFKKQGNFYEDFLDSSRLPNGGQAKALFEGYHLTKLKKSLGPGSFDLLLQFLLNPEEEQWRRLAFVQSLLHADPSGFDTEAKVREWAAGVEKDFPREIAEYITAFRGPGLYGAYRPLAPDGQQVLSHYVLIEQQAVIPPGQPYGVRVGCCLHDNEEERNRTSFQAAWNGFLRLYNFFQFLPCAYFVSSDGVEKQAYQGLTLLEKPIADVEQATIQDHGADWLQLKEVTDENVHPLLDVLEKQGWPVPVAGYELEGANGVIIASAELAWEELKLAFLDEGEQEYTQHFLQSQWQTRQLKEVLADPQDHLDLHNYLEK